MTRVGLLVGREVTFPETLINRINERDSGVSAEMVRLRGTRMNETIPYSVIIDRISHEVPYYRLYLTKAVADGAIIINNPFWWSADNKFFECVLAERLGISVPRTVVLPNKSYEADIIDESLRNLDYPIPWEEIASYAGLPAVIKPAIGGGNKDVSVVRSIDELVAAYDRSRHLTMIVQEFIDYTGYVRCFCIGREHVRVSGYDFSKPHVDRYRRPHGLSPALHDLVVEQCLALVRALGYDMDTIEMAIRDDVPIAIDFLNPAPDSDPASIGQANFEWVVEKVANLAIRYAQGEPEAPGLEWQAMVAHVPVFQGEVHP